MDINEFLSEGVTINNPNYKKGTKKKPSTTPKQIQSGNYDDAVDRDSRIGSMLSENSYDLTPLNNDENQYSTHNVRINPVNTEDELNQSRAKNQSAWEQTSRFAIQAVGNEIVLGTALGLSNLVDVAASVTKKTGENDYTSPFSKLIEDKQDEVKKRFEIYQKNPDDKFAIGDYGWWASNAVSVASTLALLIPAAGVAEGIGVAAKVGKLEKLSMGIAKAAKGVGLTDGVATLASAINSGAEIGTSALLSRTMENYQEARGTYKEVYDSSINKLKTMTPEDRTKLINNNPEFANLNDEQIAQRISGKSADETFKNDYAMLLMDMVQFKALGSMWKGIANKEVGAGLSAANRNAINSLTDDAGEAVINKGIKTNIQDRFKHILEHPLTAIEAAQLSEGVEEGYQGIQTEKGKEVADKIFDPNFEAKSLGDYAKDAGIWEQAFWGVLGGIAFQGAGTLLGNASSAIKGKIDKSKMTEQEYALSQMSDEKIREQEISSRKARMQDYTDSMKLLNQGKNPYSFKLDPDTKQPIINEGNQVNEDISKEDSDQLKTKLTNDFVTNMTMDAIDKGNLDLFKSFITDPKFNQFFSQAGLEENQGDKSFGQMVSDKMANVEEHYHQSLYDVLNSVDVENENVAKIVARNIARTKLDINDLNNTSDDLANRIATEADNDDVHQYEENERIKYAETRLNEIANKEDQIKDLLDSKQISLQAAEQISKDNNIRRNQLLAFASSNNMFGNPEVVRSILSNTIDSADTEGFINQFNEFLDSTDYKDNLSKVPDPKKSIQNIVKKKIELDDHADYLENTLPANQSDYQKQYDDIARNVDKLTIDRYNKAADTVGEYLESQPNLDEARDNVMTNNVPSNIKDQLDILKLGHHSTQRYTTQINAILRTINNDRTKAAEEAKNVTVDNNTSNDVLASNEVSNIEEVVDEVDDREEPVMDDSSTGEGQQTDTIDNNSDEQVIAEPVVQPININEEIDNIDKVSASITQNQIDELTPDNDSRAVGLASSVTFNLFKTSRNLFDNLEGKDVNSAEFNNIVDIVSDELFGEGVSRGYTRQASVDGIKLALNTIYRRLNSKGVAGADKFRELADQLATGQRVEYSSDNKASTTKLIPTNEINQVIDEFIESYIAERGVYKSKGSKTIINVEDLFRELLVNNGISYEQAKHVFFNIADYIASPNNAKYIFTNKRELNKNLKTPSTFFSNLISNKSTVETIDTYMHIAAPSKVEEGYNKAVNEALNGEPVTVGYYEGSFGNSDKSISIKRNGVEIGYLGSVQPNATNTGYTLKRQNQGFVYNINNNNGAIQSNLDKFFIPLINKENEQYSELMDLTYKQFAFETGIKNNSISQDLDSDDINKVLFNPAVKTLLSNGDLKVPEKLVTTKQRAKYILNAINNIIFYDNQAVTTPMILESYSYWKSSTYNNYSNTHKIQTALASNKKITTKLVNISQGKVLIDANNHDVNTRGFTYEQNPVMIVDTNGNIINERNNTSYSNVAGFESGSMGMLVADNPNAPIIALFTESNKLFNNADLANRTYKELTDLFSSFQSRQINFDDLGKSLGDMFSGPGVKSNNLFSGYSVIRTSDRIALNIQGKKGEYNLIIYKFEKGTNKEGTGITHIPNGVRADAKSSITSNKAFTNDIAKEIVSNLSFNRTFYGINNKNIDNEKSNKYLYKEDGKLVVNIGGVSNNYDSFGNFVLATNAFKTNQGINTDGTYFDTQDRVKSLFINAAIISSPVEESTSSNSSRSATDIIKSATKTNSVNTSQILELAGVDGAKVAVLTGSNEFNIELIPRETFFDDKTTKAEAYYTKGKMYFTNKGANAIAKSPNNLVRLLIHENLHAKFEEQELFQRDGIVDDLMDTYNAMITAVNADTTSEDGKRIRQWIADNKFNPTDYFSILSADQQKAWAKRNELDRQLQFAEEWLVESLTQPAIIRYLNNTIYQGEDINVEGIDNNAKTIWQKIVDVLLRLFNKNSGNIRNNTILAKQYSILGNNIEVGNDNQTITEINNNDSTPGESTLITEDQNNNDVNVADEDISISNFETEGRKLDEQSDIDDLDFAVTSMIEDMNQNISFGIDKVFDENSNILQIGNKSQYASYISTIFPNSQVTNIAYHDTDIKDKKFIYDANGIFTTGMTNWWQKKDNKMSLMLNIQSPLIVEGGINSGTTNDLLRDNPNNDSIITTGLGTDITKGVYVLRDPSQIHILGSKQDIQGFKDFVTNKNNTTNNTGNTNINSDTVDDIKIKSYRDNPNINMNGVQVVPDMNRYVNQFASQDKALIAKMLTANELKFQCE